VGNPPKPKPGWIQRVFKGKKNAGLNRCLEAPGEVGGGRAEWTPLTRLLKRKTWREKREKKKKESCSLGHAGSENGRLTKKGDIKKPEVLLEPHESAKRRIEKKSGKV